MQVKSFFLTLGLGIAAGGAIALMLPPQSKVKQTAQKAVDTVERTISENMEKF